MKTLRLAFRSILHFRMYSIVNLIGLALSLACVITIFRYIYGEFTVDKFNKKLDRIYVITQEMSSRPGEVSFSGVITLRGRQTIANPSEHPGVEMVSHFTRFDIDEINVDDRKYNAIIVASDSNFLKLTGFPLVSGAGKLTELNSVLITQPFAEKIFGNENPVGKTFQHSTGEILTITGVIGKTSTKATLAFDIVMSSDFSFSSMPSPQTFVMLYPGVDYRTINKQYEDYIDMPLRGYQIRCQLFPLSKVYFNKHINNWVFKQGNHDHANVLMTVGFLILLVGIINYINIYTVFVLRRGRELGVKKVFGAGRHNIFIQLLAENQLMAGFALISALFVAHITYPLINNVLQLEQTPNIHFDLLLIFGILLFLPLITTLFPFLRHNYFMPVNSLRNFDKIRGGNVRRIFLLLQYIITMIMIIVSLLFVKQLRFMLNADPGFQTKDIIKVSFQKFQSYHKPIMIYNYIKNADGSITPVGINEEFDAERAKWAEEKATAEKIAHEINACPLFTNWTSCSSPNEFKIFNFKFKSLDGEYKEIKLERASENWLKLFDIQLIEGQFWDDTMDDNNPTAFIVTESVLKLFGITDFNNAMLQSEDELWRKEKNPVFRIVGIVKDINYLHLSQKSNPIAFYFTKESSVNSDVKAAIVPGLKQEAIEFLKKLHEETVGGEFTYSFVEDEVHEMYKEDKKIATIYSVFTFIAIFVSALGLFSMSLFDMQQRRKEIAIRKVNGASFSDIIRILLKKYFWTLTISFVIATPIALFAIYRYLEDFANKATVSWWLFALALIITAGISLLTLLWQTQKAANQNPAEVVKGE